MRDRIRLSSRPSDSSSKSVLVWRKPAEEKWTNLTLRGGLLERHGLLLAHGGDDRDEQVLSFLKALGNLLAQITFRDLDVVLGDALLGHQVEETIIDIDELVFGTIDVGDIHVVCGGTDIFELLSSEDLRANGSMREIQITRIARGGVVTYIDGNEMDLGVAVLPRL